MKFLKYILHTTPELILQIYEIVTCEKHYEKIIEVSEDFFSLVNGKYGDRKIVKLN